MVGPQFHYPPAAFTFRERVSAPARIAHDDLSDTLAGDDLAEWPDE